VLLTAITAILGLLPLAIGLNFNFFTLFSELDAHVHMGGDNSIFWSPLSWAVIMGLSFATFLTLIMVPVMLLDHPEDQAPTGVEARAARGPADDRAATAAASATYCRRSDGLTRRRLLWERSRQRGRSSF
jgi:hypothetical protein